MNERMDELMNEVVDETRIRPKKKRIYRKRTLFYRCPHPAIPVRGLWEQATKEEKKTAHLQCMAILEYWLGKRSKQEVAEHLGVPSLRVWQMSQQALSGMLAGLLRQPKKRAKVTLPPARPDEDPKLLTRRIAELKKRLAHTEDLVRVLRDLPWSQVAPTTPKEPSHGRRKRSPGTTRRGHRGVPAFPANETGDRKGTAGRRGTRPAAADGTLPGPNAAHAEELEDAGREA